MYSVINDEIYSSRSIIIFKSESNVSFLIIQQEMVVELLCKLQFQEYVRVSMHFNENGAKFGGVVFQTILIYISFHDNATTTSMHIQ